MAELYPKALKVSWENQSWKAGPCCILIYSCTENTTHTFRSISILFLCMMRDGLQDPSAWNASFIILSVSSYVTYVCVLWVGVPEFVCWMLHMGFHPIQVTFEDKSVSLRFLPNPGAPVSLCLFIAHESLPQIHCNIENIRLLGLERLICS